VNSSFFILNKKLKLLVLQIKAIFVLDLLSGAKILIIFYFSRFYLENLIFSKWS